jgi:hypothetical protein
MGKTIVATVGSVIAAQGPEMVAIATEKCKYPGGYAEWAKLPDSPASYELFGELPALLPGGCPESDWWCRFQTWSYYKIYGGLDD